MSSQESSSSGPITSSFENISEKFTAYSEIPSEGFNRLFKAQRYGKWFVLKGLKPEFQQKEVYRNILTKEFELGMQMSHPNIAQTFSKETNPIVGPCIVLEYVDGVTLKEFLKQRPSRKTRMKIAQELLSAMAYYHSLQIVHRDLKPDNILITRNGYNVKIIDFGLADSDWHGVLKQPTGSDKYGAPEQKAGNMPLDCRADLYSFGKILEQLFPHTYGRIVRKCTQENREKRFSNAEEILQRLQNKNHTKLIFVAFVLVMVMIFAVWYLLQKSGNNNENIIQSIDTQYSTADRNMEADETSGVSAPLTKGDHAFATMSGNPARAKTSSLLTAEVKKSIEQSVDTLFQSFWDWNRKTTASGMAPIDKLAKYDQSDFFQNNYEIREQHREAVVSDILQCYPQCESIKDSVRTYYDSVFVQRMMAVNEEVQAWQRAIRK
ncbi:MAG: serine/threonine protein kinase [Bacteroidales bacterium]|nr:serine/threonine protein kinase [Bacteroidales bacterium]